MVNKVISELEEEQELLISLAYHSEQHKKALKKDMIRLGEQGNSEEDDLLDMINSSEEIRLKLLRQWLGIPWHEAVSLRLSSIERNMKQSELESLKQIKNNLYEFESILSDL